MNSKRYITNSKRYITPVIITISLYAALVSCTERAAQPNEPRLDSTAVQQVTLTPKQASSIGIETALPTMDTVNTVLKLQGTVDVPPQSIISLSFPLGGYLRSTSMQPGMHVRKGQVLAILEDMQFIQLQQDYLMAKEKRELNESEFQRQRELNASKASSDKVYQQARSDYESSKIMVSALEQKLAVIGINAAGLNPETISKEVRIYSPIDGYVAKVNVNIGKYTSPTDNLFELIDPRDIHLALTVFEGDLNKIAVGQQVTAYTNENPEQKYEAYVIIGNKTLTDERLAEIHCHFRKYHPELAPGMSMNGDVSIRSRNGLTVPEEAVVRWENKHYVFITKEPGKFEMVEVKVGMPDRGRQQVEGSAINERSRIVIRNAYALLMKMRNVEEGD